MSTTVVRAWILAGLVLVLGMVSWSIYEKEQTIRSGQTIFLELAPVDPRSLMQGDYMALRFQLAEQIEGARSSLPRGSSERAQISLDERRVARLARNESDGGLFLRYRFRNGNVWLGTNAYFFEEGTAQRFEAARFGEFRLNSESGEAVLVGLRDEQLQSL